MQLIPYSEALAKCRMGSSEFGWCISCHIHEPTIPFAGDDHVLCPACAHRLSARFGQLAHWFEVRPPAPDDAEDIEF